MNTIPIYILAGGKSSRYGQDKARVLFQGKPLLLHVTGLFGKISNNITVIADKAEKYDDLGVKTISDKIKGQGPLGGLHRAILDCNKNEWLLLSSCDLIGIQTRWLDLLISGIKNNVQAVAFKGDFWEPMPGLYHTASLEVVTRLLTEKRPIWHVFNSVKTNGLPVPDNWDKAININQPADMEKAKSLGLTAGISTTTWGGLDADQR